MSDKGGFKSIVKIIENYPKLLNNIEEISNYYQKFINEMKYNESDNSQVNEVMH